MNPLKRIKENHFLIAAYVLIFGLLISKAAIYTPDTYAYLRAEVHINSGYIIFLKLFQYLFKDYFEIMVVGFQLLFAFFGIHIFFKKVSKTFNFHVLIRLIVFAALVFPLFSPLYTANNLCSEGLSYPLYLICIGFAMDFLFNSNDKALRYIMVSYIFMNLVRVQFFFIPLIFIFLFILKYRTTIFKKPNFTKLGLLLILPFIVTLLDKTYHKLKDDAFISTPFSYVNAVTAAFYVSEVSDAKDITNEDNRLIFELCYRVLHQKKLLYSDVNNANSREYYLFFHENLPKICNQTIYYYGVNYFIAKGQNPVEAQYSIDNACKSILPILIKNNLKKWANLYYQNLVYGLKSSIALFVLIGIFIFSSIKILIRYQKPYGMLFFLSSLILSNALLVAFGSHAIMRYHFYNYVLILLLIITLYNSIKHGKTT